MEKVKSVVLTFFMMVTLTACLPGMGPSFSRDEVSKKLIVGITTQEEVRSMYGDPNEISKSHKGDIWTYIDEPSAIGGLFTQAAQTTGAAAVGQASAHVGLAAAEKGGVIGAAAASSTVNSLGSKAAEEVTTTVQNKKQILTIYFDTRKVVRNFSINE